MSDKNTDKNQNGQQRSEQSRNRSNYHRYNQRNHNQNRSQSSAKSPDNNRASRAHEQLPKENGQQARENVQQRSFYRDRDKDTQLRQHSAASGTRYGSVIRNKAEETIEDIKLDIIRLEKEIELEIKEIRSLKL